MENPHIHGDLHAGRRRQDNQRFRQEVRESVNQAQSNLLFYLTCFVLLAELVVSIVGTVLTWDDECDTKLHTWLVGYAIRSALYFPIVFLEQKYSNIPEQLYMQYGRQMRMFRSAKMFFEIAALMWFVLGNSYVFGSDTCRDTAPLLYRICLSWVILGYVGLGLPLILCLGLIFCFPCVYYVLQKISQLTSPSVQKAIDKVPLKKFTRGMYPEEDAVCAICLVPYDHGQSQLRVPPCGHHFHKECGDDWFKIKQHCPLCRKPIDGSEPEPEPERHTRVSYGAQASRDVPISSPNDYRDGSDDDNPLYDYDPENAAYLRRALAESQAEADRLRRASGPREGLGLSDAAEQDRAVRVDVGPSPSPASGEGSGRKSDNL